MKHESKDFSGLLENLEGISAKQLEAHFGLYKGYVAKINEIEGKIEFEDNGKSNYSYGEFSELKRREVVGFNGTYLHEMYFENLGQGEISEELKAKVLEDFGSWEEFVNDLKGCALSTPGWVLLTYNKRDCKLHTYVMYEHHVGLPVDQEILIALDCWEHAFMMDYGTNKLGYFDAFMKNINWDVVNKRFESVK
jgi:superoxide dismutase, Fe-Mn family